MEWLNDLAARLPAPRDDEPPEIRRRILAELRDHLQTAFDRELLRTGNEDQARQNVLARFGDPARLARKLWYDALWENIMSRRLLWGAIGAAVLLSLGSLGLASWLVVQSRQLTQAMLEESRAANGALLAESRQANEALVEQNRKANEALLAKVSALGGPGGTAGKSLEWNPLSVKLVYERAGGEPASGLTVSATGHLLDTGTKMSLNRKTGPDGTVGFGLVRPGEHSLDVKTPWGESLSQIGVTVLPGEAKMVEIVCPREPEEAEVSFTVDWPAELAGKGLWLLCDFTREWREIAGHSWQPGIHFEYVLVDDSGQLVNINHRVYRNCTNPHDSFFDWHGALTADRMGVYRLRTGQNVSDRQGSESSTRLWLPAIAPVSRLKWPVGAYHTRLYCAARQPEKDLDPLPGNMLHPMFLGSLQIGVNLGPGRDDSLVKLWSRNFENPTLRPTPKIEVAKFEVVAGRQNELHITPPKLLTDLLKGIGDEGQ